MELIEIRDISTSDVSVYYHMQYTANAVFDIAGGQEVLPISFTIEISPLGQKTILVKILQDINYPLIPLLRVLKAHILDLYTNGVLV